jgi:hypothetical protein
VAWNTSTNEVIDSGLERGFTEHPVVPLTGSTTYNANIGTTGEFPPSTHYVEGHGTYEAWASTQYNVSGQATREVWKLFDGSTSTYFQQSSSTGYDNYNGSSPYEYVGTRGTTTTDVGGTRYMGVWVQLKLPYTITLAYTKINNWTSNTDRSPGAGVILGSNDGDNWYKLSEFSGLTYTSNEEIVQVNATTPYQYYRMVATNTVGSGSINFTEWRLFAEKPVTRMENVHISGDLSSETLQTGYIKWPRKSLKANESEGYVATRSSRAYSNYEAWKAFNENANSSDDAWIGGLTNYTTGGYSITTSGAPEMNGVYGDWLGIELPQSIKVSYIQLLNRNYSESARLPISGRFYGSKDNITFTELTAWSNISISPGYEPTRIDVNSNDTYKTYRIQVERINAATGGGSCAIGELQLFESTLGVGTSATTAKLTVDGGLGLAKGSHVFAGSDVVMELPRHDRPLVKYPEVAMTAATTAGYTASASRFDAAYYPYKAFNGLKGGNSGDVGWHTGTEPAGGIADYTGTSNTYVGTERLSSETVLGEWITIELPKPIKLKETHLWAQFNYSHVPKGGVFYGKRNASDTWTRLYSYTERSIRDRYNPQVHIINETRYFKYFAYVATERYLSASGISVGEWELYGYEEGDTSVDVVHRSIPNKPSQQHLEVYWDANDSNSYSFADSSNVYDLSGSGVTGTITGNNGFDAEYNAWEFDGSGDYVSGQLSSIPSADFVHSVSVWVKFSGDTLSSAYPYVCFVGGASQYSGSGLYLAGSNDENPEYPLHVSLWQLDYPIQCHLGNDEWYHVAFTYPGGGWSRSSVKAYINGVRYTLGSNRSGGTENSTATFTTTNVNIRLATASAGSSFEGSIANFRVYGKALNADQVRELYEYDAPRFGHRQNLVALHKGCLGVGVAHPTSRFEVAGADGLQEFPPKAMTGYETYMDGHGVFKASASNFYAGSHFPFEAFDKDVSDINKRWRTSDDQYSSNVAIAGHTLGTDVPNGVWLKLNCPYAVNVSSFTIYPVSSQEPEEIQLWGSNNDGDWTHLSTHSCPKSTSAATYTLKHINYYTYIAYVITKNYGTEAGLYDISYYGTPAPSALEDGHMTLGKALTLPRVSGHAAGAETPRAASLVVHYDTTVDSVVAGTTVVDISGEGAQWDAHRDATYSSTDRAFTFDGTGDYVSGTLKNTGDFPFTVSIWFYETSNNEVTLWMIGSGSSSANPNPSVALAIASDGSLDFFIFSGRECRLSTFRATYGTHRWHNVVCTRVDNTLKYFINGVEQNITLTGATDTLSIAANSVFNIGARTGNQLGNNPFSGSISNFKIWDVALTAEEVAAEYALGRTGKSINLTDTSLCLGGTVPRAQLDVRGSAYINGIVGTGPTDGIIIPYGTTAQQPTGVTGMLRFNTSLGKLQVYDGTNWVTIGYTTATGGTVTYAGGYTIHTFTTSGTFTVYSAGDIELLVVAGGGGGGSGGGGAGGMITASKSVTTGTYAITVGPGGTGGGGGSSGGKDDPTSGNDSTALGYTADGGGRGGGGSISGRVGSDGGSGGGHGYDINTTTRTSGTSGQGNGGGRASRSSLGGAGGGGGAGGAGNDGNEIYGGNGGIGLQSSITGTATYYAGGGGGGLNQNDNVTYARPSGQTYGGFGGQGGGGTGTTYGYASGGTTVYASPGTDNTGGGGGGTDPELDTGGDGGDGIVIIRYLT